MALIKISNDAFNIAERIKALNPHYFIVFNTKKQLFEVHNAKQHSNTFCITCENGLNFNVINKLRKTRIENIEKLIKEIEINNQLIEREASEQVKDVAQCKAREMFDYAKHRVEDCNFDDSYSTKWV